MTQVPHPPAVVVGLDVNGLGVVRSLAAAGIEVVALDTDFDRPAAATRLAAKRTIAAVGASPSPGTGPDLISELKRVAAALPERPVLFLTQEQSVETLAGRQDELAGLYRFTLPAAEVLKCLIDKTCFQALAERLGFLVPRTVILAAPSDLSALSALRFPCILKPARKYVTYGARFKKAYRIETPEEAEPLFQATRDVAPELVVQEWIEGRDSDVYFCLQYRNRDGRTLANFVGRKLRQWPVGTGGTASCTAAPEFAAELTELTERFFAAAGMTGLCSMEYKRDARDLQFYMVEPTVGRTDYQEEIATLCGINIPFYAYSAEIGLPVSTPGSKARPAVWIDPDGYANARARDFAAGLEAQGPSYDAYWRWADPGPWLALKADALKRRLAMFRHRR